MRKIKLPPSYRALTISILLFCNHANAYNLRVIEGITFLYCGLSNNGYILYQCQYPECNAKLFAGSPLQIEDNTVLTLHAKQHNSKDEVELIDARNHDFYRSKMANIRAICSDCGEGVRRNRTDSHTCQDMISDTTSYDSSTNRTTFSSLLTSSSANTTREWVDHPPPPASWKTNKPLSGVFNSTSDSTDSTGSTCSTCSTGLTVSIASPTPPDVSTLSLYHSSTEDSTLDEITLIFTIQERSGGPVTAHLFQRIPQESQPVWQCISSQTVLTTAQVQRCPNGQMGSVDLDCNGTFRVGFRNPLNEPSGSEGKAYIMSSDDTIETLKGNQVLYNESGIRKQKKNNVYIKDFRYPNSIPHICSDRNGEIYKAHQIYLHSRTGKSAITRGTHHYLQEALSCCAVQTSTQTWVFTSICPSQKHKDNSQPLTDNQRRFSRWSSSSKTVDVPAFGKFKSNQFYNYSLNGVAINDSPYICYLCHGALSEASHLQPRIFRVKAPHTTEEEIQTEPNWGEITGVTPLEDERILAFPCAKTNPHVGIYNPESRTWSYEKLALTTQIPYGQYVHVIVKKK